jgi:hypothetical protein
MACPTPTGALSALVSGTIQVGLPDVNEEDISSRAAAQVYNLAGIGAEDIDFVDARLLHHRRDRPARGAGAAAQRRRRTVDGGRPRASGRCVARTLAAGCCRGGPGRRHRYG